MQTVVVEVEVVEYNAAILELSKENRPQNRNRQIQLMLNQFSLVIEVLEYPLLNPQFLSEKRDFFVKPFFEKNFSISRNFSILQFLAHVPIWHFVAFLPL